MLLPALSKAREMARRMKCASNLKQFGMASVMYANDNDGWLPVSTTSKRYWDYQLASYLNYDYAHLSRKDFSVFHCPSERPNITYNSYRSRGYAYNDYIVRWATYNTRSTARLFKVETPSNTVLMTDAAYNANTSNSYEGYTSMYGISNLVIVHDGFDAGKIAYRHSERTNVLFADGHVKSCEKGYYNAYGHWVPKGTKWKNGGTVY